jgi:LysM repeat protein
MSAVSAISGSPVSVPVQAGRFEAAPFEAAPFESFGPHGIFDRDAGSRDGDRQDSARRQESAPAAAARQAPLRLTRRGRFVFFGLPLILLAALVLSLAGFLNAPAKAADSSAELSLTPTVTVTVQPGESLWAIAGTVAPERDPRDVIADIVQLNNLADPRVIPGQQLFVPSK